MLKYQSFTKSWYLRGTIAFQHLLWCLVTMVQTPPAPLPQFTQGKRKKKEKAHLKQFCTWLLWVKKHLFFKNPPPLPLSLIKNTSLGPIFRKKNTSLTAPNATRMDHWCKKACPDHTHTPGKCQNAVYTDYGNQHI